MSERSQRRLAAIVAADVAGYSRLVGLDEEGTLAALRALREELIDPLLAEHGGRIANTAGDSLLLEFPSVVDAVRCALAVQEGMAERHREVEEEKRIRLRVGVHLGDVVAEGNDLLGDGVNVAARLEGLCAPGGVVLSDDAYRQVRDRLERAWIDDGEHEVKNIARPVQVWRWAPEDTRTAIRTATKPPLALPDKPSIAVLPFDNMSGDPEQEYFSDGITEDIIAALSRVGWFFVIARNSSFTFKGRAVEVRKIAEELGVHYVLEGSVRRSSNRLRVTAQLIDAESGNHIWADRYDGILEDVFDFQDNVTASVVGTIEPKLRRSEIDKVINKRTDNLGAYDFLLRAYHSWFVYSKERNREAQFYTDEALKIDPEYSPALGLGAMCRALSAFFYWSEDQELDRENALKMAQKSLDHGSDNAGVLRHAGAVRALVLKDHDEARALIDKSLVLDPNSAESWGYRGWANIWDERPGEAKEDFARALRLSPLDPLEFNYANGLTYAHVGLGEFQEALAWARTAAREMPQWIAAHRGLALALALAGRVDEARAVGCDVLRIDPSFTIRSWVEASPFVGGSLLDQLVNGLRLAGLPD